MKKSLAFSLLVLLGASTIGAAAPADLLKTYFGDQAASVAAPAAPPHQVVLEQASAKSASSGHWQAIAKVKSMTHRGSIPQWTHQCYPTAQQAKEAAEAACERCNHTACISEPYIASRCDR